MKLRYCKPVFTLLAYQLCNVGIPILVIVVSQQVDCRTFLFIVLAENETGTVGETR